jgi:hypothetical protein
MPPGPAGLDAGAACSAALEPSDSAVAAEAASADTAATGAAATDPAADDTQACGTAASESAERPGRFPALSIPSPLAWGRRSLGRVRAVMRDCYEETIAGFAHDDEFQREQKQDATSGVPADPGAVPHPDADLAPAAASIAAGRVPPGQVMPDSREPFDSFSGLEPAPPGGIAFSRRSSAAAPPAVSSPPVASAATPASPAPATCPAGSRAPAPGPSGLEDLRSWLPDPDEDRDDAFPRAS